MQHFLLLLTTFLIEFTLLALVIMLVKLLTPYFNNETLSKRKELLRKNDSHLET